MKLSKIFKKSNLSWKNKTPREIETDAAPSRPRSEEDMTDPSSSSDEDNDCHARTNADSPLPESRYINDKDIPNFKKDDSSTFNGGGQTIIHIENSKSIQIGNRYEINFTNSKPTPSKGDTPPQPQEPEAPSPEIERMFSNRKAAESADFISIKFEIGSNWRRVAEKLELSTGIIEQVYEKYQHRGASEVFYQLMLKWKESQPRSTTTIGLLCEALWKANETSAAKQLAKLHSTDN